MKTYPLGVDVTSIPQARSESGQNCSIWKNCWSRRLTLREELGKGWAFFTAYRTKCTRLSAPRRSLLYNLGMWLGRRRIVFAPFRQPRLSAHSVGAVLVNTPDT